MRKVLGRRVGNGGEMRRSRQELDAWVDQLHTDEGAIGDLARRLVVERHTEPKADFVGVIAEAARSVESVPVHKSRHPLARKWRRRAMISTFLSSLAGKLAIASVAVAASAGGLTATGNLPGPMQDFAHDALSNVGIEVPSGTELPDEASDTANSVLGVIDDGDLARGEDFGKAVAEEATGDNADIEGLTDDAGSEADDAEDNSSVADDYTDGAGSQADDAEGNASVADDYTGDAGSEADDASTVSTPENPSSIP